MAPSIMSNMHILRQHQIRRHHSYTQGRSDGGGGGAEPVVDPAKGIGRSDLGRGGLFAIPERKREDVDDGSTVATGNTGATNAEADGEEKGGRSEGRRSGSEKKGRSEGRSGSEKKGRSEGRSGSEKKGRRSGSGSGSGSGRKGGGGGRGKRVKPLIERLEKSVRRRSEPDAKSSDGGATCGIRGGELGGFEESEEEGGGGGEEGGGDDSDSPNSKGASVEFEEDLEGPAPDPASAASAAASGRDDASEEEDVGAMVEDYEREIRRLETLNATLAANVQALTAAAFDDDGGGDATEHVVVEVERCKLCGSECEISDADERGDVRSPAGRVYNDDGPSAEFLNTDIYNDMILTEEHYINQISKLQKSSHKMQRKLEKKQKLIAQLSMNLKTAADRIQEVGREKDEWRTKFETLAKEVEEERERIQREDSNRSESAEQIRSYQVQVLENECRSLLRLLKDRREIHSRDRRHLLDEYRDQDAVWNGKLESPQETLRRVMQRLRSGDQVPDWRECVPPAAAEVAPEATAIAPEAVVEVTETVTRNVDAAVRAGDRGETNRGATRGVNVWDSVTSLFGSPSGQQQRQRPQPPQNQRPRHSRPQHQQPRQEARALDGDDRPPRGAIEPLDKNGLKRTPSGSHGSSSDDGDGSVASSISSRGDCGDESNGEEETSGVESRTGDVSEGSGAAEEAKEEGGEVAKSAHPRSGKGLVGFDDDDDDDEDGGRLEDEGDAFDGERSTRGVNVWDSVTSLFGGPSGPQQRQRQRQQQQQPEHQQPRHHQPRQETRALDGDDRPPRGAMELLDGKGSRRTPPSSRVDPGDRGEGSMASSISSHVNSSDESEEEDKTSAVESRGEAGGAAEEAKGVGVAERARPRSGEGSAGPGDDGGGGESEDEWDAFDGERSAELWRERDGRRAPEEEGEGRAAEPVSSREDGAPSARRTMDGRGDVPRGAESSSPVAMLDDDNDNMKAPRDDDDREESVPSDREENILDEICNMDYEPWKRPRQVSEPGQDPWQDPNDEEDSLSEVRQMVLNGGEDFESSVESELARGHHGADGARDVRDDASPAGPGTGRGGSAEGNGSVAAASDGEDDGAKGVSEVESWEKTPRAGNHEPDAAVEGIRADDAARGIAEDVPDAGFDREPEGAPRRDSDWNEETERDSADGEGPRLECDAESVAGGAEERWLSARLWSDEGALTGMRNLVLSYGEEDSLCGGESAADSVGSPRANKRGVEEHHAVEDECENGGDESSDDEGGVEGAREVRATEDDGRVVPRRAHAREPPGAVMAMPREEPEAKRAEEVAYNNHRGASSPSDQRDAPGHVAFLPASSGVPTCRENWAGPAAPEQPGRFDDAESSEEPEATAEIDDLSAQELNAVDDEDSFGGYVAREGEASGDDDFDDAHSDDGGREQMRAHAREPPGAVVAMPREEPEAEGAEEVARDGHRGESGRGNRRDAPGHVAFHPASGGVGGSDDDELICQANGAEPAVPEEPGHFDDAESSEEPEATAQIDDSSVKEPNAVDNEDSLDDAESSEEPEAAAGIDDLSVRELNVADDEDSLGGYVAREGKASGDEDFDDGRSVDGGRAPEGATRDVEARDGARDGSSGAGATSARERVGANANARTVPSFVAVGRSERIVTEEEVESADGFSAGDEGVDGGSAGKLNEETAREGFIAPARNDELADASESDQERDDASASNENPNDGDDSEDGGTAAENSNLVAGLERAQNMPGCEGDVASNVDGAEEPILEDEASEEDEILMDGENASMEEASLLQLTCPGEASFTEVDASLTRLDYAPGVPASKEELIPEYSAFDCLERAGRTNGEGGSIEEASLSKTPETEGDRNTKPAYSNEASGNGNVHAHAPLVRSNESAPSALQQSKASETGLANPELLTGISFDNHSESFIDDGEIEQCRKDDVDSECNMAEIDDDSDGELLGQVCDYETDGTDEEYVARETRDEDDDRESGVLEIAAEDSDDDSYNPKEYAKEDESNCAREPDAEAAMKPEEPQSCGMLVGNDNDQAEATREACFEDDESDRDCDPGKGEELHLEGTAGGNGNDKKKSTEEREMKCMDVASQNQHEEERSDKEISSDKNAMTGKQCSVADSDIHPEPPTETLPDTGDIPSDARNIPSTIEIGPMPTRSPAFADMSSATAVTDASQACAAAALEDKFITANISLAHTLEMIKEQSRARMDDSEGDRSPSHYHNVVSQYTTPAGSARTKNRDDPLSHRLTRKQLFQHRGSSRADTFADVVDDVFHRPEDRQVLVTSRDVKQYLVPRYNPPVLPPEMKRRAPLYKKGKKEDGYFLYKSSSGNEYAGHWKDGRRHGYGMAKYRDGEVFNGEWRRGRRHGHGVLHLANGEVFDGDWSRNKKHGLGVYYWRDGEVDVSWYRDDVRLESLRWTRDRRRAYALDLSSSSKEQLSLVRAAGIVKGWERKSETYDC